MKFITWLKKKHHYGRYKIVKELIRGKGKNLLDVGCGSPSNVMEDGSFLRFLGYGTGMDIEKRNIPFPFFRGRIEKIPFKDKSFDVITVIEVIEHVKDPNLALNELARVLKDEGTLILTTPNNHFLFKIFWFLWGHLIDHSWLHEHISSYNKREWLTRIKKNRNFRVTYLKNYWGVNLIIRLEKIKDVRKILVIRSGAIGDVIMTTPLLRALRNSFKKARISYLVGNWSKTAVEGNPNIDEIISYDDKIIFKKRIFGVINLIKKIRKRHFDLCIVLDKSYLWGLFALFCRIPQRIGFSRRWEGFANTKNVKYDGTKYELDYNLDIAKLLGLNVKSRDMELFTSKADKEFADKFIRKNKLSNKKLIGIAPGGAVNPGQVLAIKRWPKERYAELADSLIEKYNATILIFGGMDDKGIVRDTISPIRNKSKVFDVSGITLKQSAALMKKCKLFVSHDSGPMHIAVAVKIPLVAVFGPTDPKRFAPKNATIIRRKIKCSPCYDAKGRYNKKCTDNKCMQSIQVEDVLKKINLK